MANLTDTGVNGDLRVTGTIFGTHAGNFAVCSTAGDDAAKTVTLSGFTLTKSAHVYVNFTNANSVANPTLNVSGTGAKNIKYKGANLANYHTLDGKMYEFVYDGSYWNVVGDLLPLASNTTPGIAKLYDNVTGSNTDGAPSQSAVKSALDGKLSGVSVNGTACTVTNNVAAIPIVTAWNSSPSNNVIPSEKLVNDSIYRNGEQRFYRDGTTDATIGKKGWFKLAETSLTISTSYYTISGRWDCNFFSYRDIISDCCIDLCLYKPGASSPLSVRRAIIHCDPYKDFPIELCVRYNNVDTDAATVPLVVEIWGKLTYTYIGAYLKECASARNSRYGNIGTYNNWTYYDASNTGSSLGSEKPTTSGNFTFVDLVKHYELSSEAGTAIGASNTPVYIGSDGKVKESTYDLSTMVTGPSSATNGAIPLFNGTTGKIIQNSSYTPASFATSSQGLKADSAIQSVTVNGTALPPDANKAVNIQLATYDVSTQNDGAMSIADKYTANYYSVSSDTITTAGGTFAACKLAYLSANANLDQNGITGLVSYFNNTSNYALFKFELTVTMKGESCHATMTCLKREGTFGIPKFYTVKTSSVLAVYVKLESVDVADSSDYWYVTWGPIPSLKVGARVGKAVTQMVIDPTERDVTSSWDTIADKKEVPTANIQWEAVASGSSSNAPVKVDAYGKLSAVTVDQSPNPSNTNNLISSKAVANALNDLDADVMHKSGPETASGIKTFSNGVKIGDSCLVSYSSNDGAVVFTFS